MSHAKSSGAVTEVAPGVWAIRVPMPRHPLRASFCYVYAQAGRAAVIDPGWPTPESWAQLEVAFGHIGLEIESVESILLTHVHRDHSGLAGRLAARSGASVALHPADRVLLPQPPERHQARVQEWLGLVGAMPEAASEAIDALPAPPTPLTVGRWLRDGEVLAVPGGELIVHWTPGHTPGHVCFEDRNRGLLFSGDHLLPRITPNVSSMVGHRTTALADYLQSLERVRALDSREVMPGHEYAFQGAEARATGLIAHHRARLHEIVMALGALPRQSTHDVAQALSWSRPWSGISGLQRRAALGEVLSHLYYLEAIGAVVRVASTPTIEWSIRAAGALEEEWRRTGRALAAM
ncbi:MBL fold metallo-hydrolase [Ruicaihuangia caeni]|uniref:MBL fold metallo-hydrolase n=1 Tax=Ruicaihuangia caeni TaxID=3042517 RepID=A0AAW6T4R1_9MICO|nr:MBL fold metallo-hydrolase [Klugiella sp. YN-L-19]MDI2098707.1 MBL fold metallo-hydrolase [Klugiella sp. YN-L-19]